MKRCRQQIGMSLDVVRKQVKKIDEIEAGNLNPTLVQLSKLQELYAVPRWVFLGEELPADFDYSQQLAFRKLRLPEALPEDNSGKVAKLVAGVEQYRQRFIDLREDIDEPVPTFQFPHAVDGSRFQESLASQVRTWLGIEENQKPEFDEYRARLEAKNIFVFLTSKYNGWAKFDPTAFRGISIYRDLLPIIVVNDSDAMKARTFTLIHELGHILQKQSELSPTNEAEETFCNKLAGSVLLPKSWFGPNVMYSLDGIKDKAESCKVSAYAFLVRLRQLGRIDRPTYYQYEAELKREHAERKEAMKQRGGGSRVRWREVKTQLGDPFIRAIITAYHSNEMTLHKSMKLLELKRFAHFDTLISELG